jgi:hypothetical protein
MVACGACDANLAIAAAAKRLGGKKRALRGAHREQDCAQLL